MLAMTHPLREVFGLQGRYVVPLFQRPYVWNQSEQWAPLWSDILELLDQVVGEHPTDYPDDHFLGAIVLDEQHGPTGRISVRHVVDGQQRLTTLQLLLHAAWLVVSDNGDPRDAEALLDLIENRARMLASPEQEYKVWPTDRDQAGFAAALRVDEAVQRTPEGSPLEQAHQFFVNQVLSWLYAASDYDRIDKCTALTTALRDRLKVVVIDLEAGDNAQVIFETLNHRGARLLAADLIKNTLFQAVERAGGDPTEVYRATWHPLDDPYWRDKVRQGRLQIPRIDLFVTHWLQMKLAREVNTDRLFTTFRDGILKRDGEPAANPVALLTELSHDAAVYARFDELPAGSPEGRFYYRVIQAMDNAVFSPVLLWLMRNDAVPAAERKRVLDLLESWVIRRALVRASANDLNRAVHELLGLLNSHGGDPLTHVGRTVQMWLTLQTADSRYWPTDAQVVETLSTYRIYASMKRSRLRMVLEALEDDARGRLGEQQPCPRDLTVEHVMPQTWRPYWGGDVDGDIEAASRRDERVQTLGNLTLVTDKLNPVLSNYPWSDEAVRDAGLSGRGKRALLLDNSELKLNAQLVSHHEHQWTDVDVQARTLALAARLNAIWPYEPYES